MYKEPTHPKQKRKAKVQNSHFKFLQNSFQSFNFAFFFFSTLNFRLI